MAADLLSREFGAQLEVFKAGRDAGIDLRHSRVLPTEARAIVQCKRYVPHRYAALVRAMGQELPKLAKLKPERYLLVTSVKLSPPNKDELLRLLQPWCRGPEDIYGAAEILALLRKFPDVERAHFKLWISSTAVLELRPVGDLINFRRGTDISREWRDDKQPNSADRILTRLKIAERIRDVTTSHCELKQRLTSGGGWNEILTGVMNDDSVAYSVERLVEWVQANDTLDPHDYEVAGESFRSYLYPLLLSPDDLWPISVTAITELAKALALFGREFSPAEKAAFRTAVLAAADTVYDNFDDPGALESEAEAVREAGVLCGVDLAETHDRLIGRAQERATEEPAYDSRYEGGGYAAEANQEQGVDALFAGLVDR